MANTITEIETECPICFYNIDNNAFIKTECCNQKIHIHCLIDWYLLNPKNCLCFICNQINPFINDLVNFGVIINNNENSEQIVNTIINNNINNYNDDNIDNIDNNIINIEIHQIPPSTNPIRCKFNICAHFYTFIFFVLGVGIFISCSVVLLVYYL